MTKFRPCIDLHDGKVKQIIGGTLDNKTNSTKINFESEKDADWYASMYRDDALFGGHVIQLGPGNQKQALKALKAFPGGLQIGGGITHDNAKEYLDAGASHIIVTSYMFTNNKLDIDKLKVLKGKIGKNKIVLDLSCRGSNGNWRVAINKWQTLTDLSIDSKVFELLEDYCDEFLIHAADVEGLQNGIDEQLIEHLTNISNLPITYAGGSNSIDDLNKISALSNGKLDLTIGSALDVFGGSKIKYRDCVNFNLNQASI